MIHPNVQRVLDNPGLYVGHIPLSFIEAPLISKDGKVFSVKVATMEIDRELDPTGFDPETVFTGPLTRERWETAV